jgi:hypothetical protein
MPYVRVYRYILELRRPVVRHAHQVGRPIVLVRVRRTSRLEAAMYPQDLRDQTVSALLYLDNN